MKITNSYKHGMTKTPFYKDYMNAKARCNNKKTYSYYLYGGRGIKFLWKDFLEFKNDMYDSYLEHKKEYGLKETSLDRIDNDKHYCKENCRWSTIKEQQNNRRNNHIINVHGKNKTLMQWSEKSGIHWATILSRIRKNKFSDEHCIFTPPRKAIFMGVYYSQPQKKWYTQVSKDGIRYTRGMFDTADEAKSVHDILLTNI